ncbi:MAG: LD-carboxypeptidase [Eubacterium sp.]|nr:LD-carboxypeptidase [Eubacterium sp.]
MIWPKKLLPGATVGLVALSSPCKESRVAECIAATCMMGYKVKEADNLAEDLHGLFAGSAKARADSLHQMFADPDVDAIWCIRGGDGSSRVMPYLDYDLIRANPKPFIGYSDITNYLIGISQNCGFVTFHGPMVSSNVVDNFDEETKDSFYRTVNAEGDFEFLNPAGKEIGVLREGRASGRIIGGNLSLVSATVGTPFEIDTAGNLLFLEEVAEPVSKIEKYMMHLKNAGVLSRASGILLGQFTDITRNCDPDYGELECIAEILEDVDVPVFTGVESGHGYPMMTLPIGAEAVMDTADRSLRIKVER